MRGIVPGVVFPKVSPELMGDRSSDVVGRCVTKGVVRYAGLSGRRKFSKAVANIEADLSQFVSQRDPVYLDTFARYKADLG